MQKMLRIGSLLLICLLSGCGPEEAEFSNPLGVDAWLPMRIGEMDFEIQVPLTQAEQQKGLMYRDSLPEDRGMLFPKKRPQRFSFWMMNTRIPLDIGFFDSDGLLLEVHRMYPNDTDRTVSQGDNLQYALEMNLGWFSGNGIYPGERLDMELLEQALRRRGADPREFGLPPGD